MIRTPEGSAPNFKNKSWAIAAKIDVPPGGAEGVLATIGGRFGGWVLMLQDSMPEFLYAYSNQAEHKYRIASAQPIAPGPHVVRFAFKYDGGGFGKGATGTLFVDGKQVAEGRIDHSIPIRFSLDETFDIGSDTGTPVITTTAAASLIAGQSLQSVASGRSDALIALVLLVGGFQILFGALNFGRLTRFVSYSVTTGFLFGISTLLIVSQIPTVAGCKASGSNQIMRAIDVFAHYREINLSALATGVLALALAVLLPRTRLRSVGRLVAVVVPSLLIALIDAHVQIVSDVGEIAGTIPTPQLPAFTVADTLNIVTGAISIAIVTLVPEQPAQ